MSETILITGSSGTVGTALTMALKQRNYRVIPLDIKRSLWDEAIDRRTVSHDLRRPLHRQHLPGRPDLIIHLAANARVYDSVDNPAMARDNYLMTYNVLEFARASGVRRILFSSSREIYGESKAEERRAEGSTSPDKMKSPYTASKFGSEALLRAYYECYGIRPVIARLSNVYGKYDVSERVIPLFLYRARRDYDLAVFGAEKKLDFTYIDDCTDGLLRIVERFDRVCGLTFNVCTGHGTKIIKLARDIVKHLGSKSEVVVARRRTGEISSFVGDISMARRKLGYSPKVDIQEGLLLAIEWYFDAVKSRRVYQAQRRILKRRGRG